jgi:hypothetical protein
MDRFDHSHLLGLSDLNGLVFLAFSLPAIEDPHHCAITLVPDTLDWAQPTRLDFQLSMEYETC